LLADEAADRYELVAALGAVVDRGRDSVGALLTIDPGNTRLRLLPLPTRGFRTAVRKLSREELN
jgi:hypothetical protein